MKTLRFGIEIETVGLNRSRLAEAIRSVVGGTASSDYGSWCVTDTRGRPWRVVPDGSLSGGENSGEVVSPILSYDDIDELQSIVRALRAAGAKADPSTGIHIHIDGSRFAAKGATILVKTVYKQERLLEHALGISATRLQRYCRPIDPGFLQRIETHRPKTMQQLSDAWYGYHNPRPQRYDGSRYHGLNLNSLFFRGTIEWRFFNGTLHAGKVKAYVHLVLAMAAKALTAKAASSKRRDFNVATAKYDLRVFLLSLGFIGDEFKSTRKHLTAGLGGSAAWKGERRDRRPTTAPEEVHNVSAVA